MFYYNLLYKVYRIYKYLFTIINVNKYCYDIIFLVIYMGNGIDLIKIDRFDKLKKNDNFLKSVFLESELKYIEKANYSSNTIAGLYAAKEAFLKAIKKGINDYSMLDIEILHDNDNAPFIILHNSLKDKYTNISVSISHDGDYAIAIVTLF